MVHNCFCFQPEPEYVNCNGGAPVYKINGGKTTVYTYHAFFASDGRSKKKLYEFDIVKPKYKCNECGKNYATSSNLSRHIIVVFISQARTLMSMKSIAILITTKDNRKVNYNTFEN